MKEEGEGGVTRRKRDEPEGEKEEEEKKRGKRSNLRHLNKGEGGGEHRSIRRTDTRRPHES